MNTGLILEPPHQGSPLLGASLPVRNPLGDWESSLPDFKAQAKLGLETMNCVQFSFLNVLQTVSASYGKKFDLSDRFMYWASGCTANGNSYSNCIAGFLKRGCCAEGDWPWFMAMTRELYGEEPPDDIKAEAELIFSDWELGVPAWVSLDLDSMKAALKLSPLWFCNSVHSMMIYRIDDQIRVFDSEAVATHGIGSFPLDYVQHIEACYNLPFTPKTMPTETFSENTMYQLVEGPGGFFLFAKGRMYSDDAAKIQASWTVRNGVTQADGSVLFSGGKVGTLRIKDLVGVPVFNLKDEPVTV